MDLNTKYRTVKAWLDSLYAGKPVPNFERNEKTIDWLWQLMEKNTAVDRDTQLTIQDLQQKTTEYTAEGQRLGNILSALNLKTGALSQSGVMTLRTLANLAWLLQIKDTTDTSYLLALHALQDEEDRVYEELIAEERVLAQLTLKTKDALVKHSRVFGTFRNLETQASQQEAKIEKEIKEKHFLHTKSQEYAKHIAQLKGKLKQSGVDATLFHESLVRKSEELHKIEEELEPLKKKLQNYHDLPADISEAKVKLAELRKRVNEYETQLSCKIDLMKL